MIYCGIFLIMPPAEVCLGGKLIYTVHNGETLTIVRGNKSFLIEGNEMGFKIKQNGGDLEFSDGGKTKTIIIDDLLIRSYQGD